MKKINIRIFTVLFAVFLCITIFPATAFAGGGEEEIPLTLCVRLVVSR